MAFDMFLEFTGDTKVVGEATDAQHPNTLALSGFEFGMENTNASNKSPAGVSAGKAEFKTLSVTRNVDQASPALFAAAAAVTALKQANLFVRKAGSQNDFIVYRFRQVLVSSLSWSGDNADAQPTETVEFKYAALQVQYTPTDKTGQLGTTKSAAWNMVTNTPDFLSN
jgi:type VI secretion system secreted protein Hcp